jgi:hypothetical protein
MAGAGTYGSVWLFNISSGPMLILKIVSYRSYSKTGVRVNPISKDRPENVEFIIWSMLWKIFDRNKRMPKHVIIPYDSFVCSTKDSRFQMFIDTLKEKMFEHYYLTPSDSSSSDSSTKNNGLMNFLFRKKKSVTKPQIKRKDYDKVIRSFNSPFFRLTITEYADKGRLDEFVDENTSLYIYKILLFQIIISLAYIHKYFPSFRHNDLHSGNILVKTWKEDLYYKFDDKTYHLANPKIFILINDFDFATAKGVENIKDAELHTRIDSSYSDIHRILFSIFDMYDDGPTGLIPNPVIEFISRHIPLQIRTKYFYKQLIEWSKEKSYNWNPEDHIAIKLLDDKLFSSFIVNSKSSTIPHYFSASPMENKEDICSRWNRNKKINPLTNRKIKKNSIAYKELDHLCRTYKYQ